MPLIPSLPDNAHLSDLFSRFPDGASPLLAFHDVVLRGEGELSVGQREMIAAYVSGLNACSFCFASHKTYAELFGIDPGLIDAAVADLATAPVEEKLRPILAYAAKLNRLPSRLVQADAEAVFAAGWTERALFEAVRVAALFNMMNRIVEGTGVDFDYAADPARHPAHGSTPEAQAHSYARFGERIAAAGKGVAR